ncbi:serpentine type 7TM GPCR chemoreceptor srt domain-containing protein [Ditylenchus destructor]|nr:serpentine type 7TM GPCR chemoreceptor srt domain-containing protein [Ditylenchus destructor]
MADARLYKSEDRVSYSMPGVNILSSASASNLADNSYLKNPLEYIPSSTLISTVLTIEYFSFPDVFVGVLMVLSSLLCIFINAIVIKVMIADDNLYRLNSYKFMIALGISCIAQSFVHAITGFFTIFQNTWNPIFHKILGSIITPSYVSYSILTIVLSINRLIFLMSSSLDQTLFSKKGMKVWFAVCIIPTLGFSSALLSPWSSILYSPTDWSWSYDYNAEGSWLVQRIEMVIEVGGIFASGIIYAIIFWTIIRKRNIGQQINVASNNKNVTRGNYTAIQTDVKILIQAFTITAYCTVLNVFWHDYENFHFPNTRLAYMALNFMWIGNSAVNPLVYFAVNSALRRRISLLIRCVRAHKPNNCTQVAVISHSDPNCAQQNVRALFVHVSQKSFNNHKMDEITLTSTTPNSFKNQEEAAKQNLTLSQ